MVIRGTNLPSSTPTVTMDGGDLQVLNWSPTQITVVLPTSVVPGNYLLKVQGSAVWQIALFIATIGAQGPPGPQGLQGV